MTEGVCMAKTENMDIEIRDKEIDVEEIMRKIQDNVKKRKIADIEHLDINKIPETPVYNIKQDLESVKANLDIENRAYNISSHRKVLGPFLVGGRKLVHGEIKRYVDLTILRQKEFNESAARVLDYLSREVPEIKEQLTEQKTNMRSLSREVPEIKEQINEHIDLDYFKFENKFRGSEEDIKKRQKIYVQYFKSKKNVLDVGCGRGEFLELLRENGVDARGVDANKNMVKYCNKKRLNVNLVDGADYLKSISDNSLGGIFMAQVIEHFKPRKMVEIINLSYKKLKKGSNLVIETVNPESFVSLSNFDLDLSHVKSLHPSLLEFLLQSAGFRKVEVKFLSPVPEESKLKKIEPDTGLTKQEKKFLELYNENVGKLNSIIYGYQDYSIIAKK
jgi:2-polyprenyl-3-methyl-5-hydroxy-6-metoxy-1,4-benzoquinol methylase